jgi:hypothetical protein
MNLKTIQAIILQNQKLLSEGESVVQRTLRIETIPKKAAVLIGIRRCGKSTYIRNLVSSEVDDKSLVCHIDFADDRLVSLQTEEPAQIADAYYQLYPDHHDKTVYFFFDEIQLVNDWALFVNRLQNTEKCHVFITGSSAKMLSWELATELGGRTMSWELFPYSFKEYLFAHGLDSKIKMLSSIDKVHNIFSQYLKWGGFPELLYIQSENQKTRYLQNIAMDVISRDIAMRYKVQDLPLLHTLMLLLLGTMSRSITVNKLKQKLSGMHYSTSNEWISKYIRYFSDAYLIFPVEILSPNIAVRSVNPKKIYCVDHALALACDFKLFNNMGAVLENMVFVHLRRQTFDIHYYKTSNGHEVDFVTGTEGNLSLYQVCVDLEDEDTKNRELRAIKEACIELQCQRATVVTLQQTETIHAENCEIMIVKAVDWLV